MKDYCYGIATSLVMVQLFHIVDDSVPNGLDYYFDILISF